MMFDFEVGKNSQGLLYPILVFFLLFVLDTKFSVVLAGKNFECDDFVLKESGWIVDGLPNSTGYSGAAEILKSCIERFDKDVKNGEYAYKLSLLYSYLGGSEEEEKYLKISAENGYGLGLMDLGVAYLDGEYGGDRDSGVILLLRAGDKGVGAAYTILADYYTNIAQSQKNIDLALEYALQAARLGDSGALVLLAVNSKKKDFESWRSKVDNPMDLLLRAFDMGNDSAGYFLYKMLLESDCKKCAQPAEYYLFVSAERKFIVAMSEIIKRMNLDAGFTPVYSENIVKVFCGANVRTAELDQLLSHHGLSCGV